MDGRGVGGERFLVFSRLNERDVEDVKDGECSVIGA